MSDHPTIYPPLLRHAASLQGFHKHAQSSINKEDASLPSYPPTSKNDLILWMRTSFPKVKFTIGFDPLIPMLNASGFPDGEALIIFVLDDAESIYHSKREVQIFIRDEYFSWKTSIPPSVSTLRWYMLHGIPKACSVCKEVHLCSRLCSCGAMCCLTSKCSSKNDKCVICSNDVDARFLMGGK